MVSPGHARGRSNVAAGARVNEEGAEQHITFFQEVLDHNVVESSAQGRVGLP